MDNVKYGIVGLGNMGRAHRENITLHKMKEHAFGLTLQRSGDEGAKASAASSMFKYYGLSLIHI